MNYPMVWSTEVVLAIIVARAAECECNSSDQAYESGVKRPSDDE